MEEDTSLLDSSAVKKRNKKPISAYYVLFTLVFVVLFLVCAISLGCFGETQRKLHNFVAELEENSTKCILFGSYVREKSDGSTVISLSHIGTCAFVLWGQVSILIVSFVWIIYSVVQAVIAPKIISVLRVLDFLVMGLAFLLCFALSVTVSAGLNKTCNAHRKSTPCALNYLVSPANNSDEKLFYYEGLHAAQSSLWVACVMFLCLAIFNIILVIVQCVRFKNRKKEALAGDDNASQASSEPSNLAAEKKPGNTFK